MQIVLTKTQIDQKIMRLAHQILENATAVNHVMIHSADTVSFEAGDSQ